MRSDEELRAFVRTELAAAIEAHAAERRRIYRSIRIWPAIVLALAGALAAIAMEHPAPLLAPLVYGVFALVWASQRAHVAGKYGLIGPVLRFWNPSLEYDPGCFLAESVFRKSGLFSERWNSYDGEDWVSGRVGETTFKLCELDVRRTRGEDKSDVLVFQGLFVVADFPKSFSGRTYLFPDVAEQQLGVFGRVLQKLDSVPGCRLVELESPELEQHFAVYASDPVEARYLLSPSLLERILAFRTRTGRPLRIALADESLYLALPGTGDLFERMPSSPAAAESAVRSWIADLELATSVIHELDLNTRIWSKRAPPATAASA